MKSFQNGTKNIQNLSKYFYMYNNPFKRTERLQHVDLIMKELICIKQESYVHNFPLQ